MILPGLSKLRDGLQEWNKKAQAVYDPYDNEVEWLDNTITHLQGRLDAGESMIRENTSVETDQFLRAAALLSIYLKEREVVEGRASGFPQRVIEAMEEDVSWTHQRADQIGDVEPHECLWALIPNPNVKLPSKNQALEDPESNWDVFISHAAEDKEPFVRELAEALKASGLKVWFDQFTLKVGDSLRESIDNGLAKTKFGIVILSPYFFAKEWPQKELNGLVAREIDGRKVILPVWHNIDSDEVRRFSPILADRVAVKSAEGMERVVRKLLDVIAGHPPA